MSRIDIAEFVNEMLRELPDLPEALGRELAKAALEPESRRVAALRNVLERSSTHHGSKPATASRDG